MESTLFEVAWEYQFDAEVFHRRFREEERAGRFFDSLQALGGLEWISFSHYLRTEMYRRELLSEWVKEVKA